MKLWIFQGKLLNIVRFSRKVIRTWKIFSRFGKFGDFFSWNWVIPVFHKNFVKFHEIFAKYRTNKSILLWFHEKKIEFLQLNFTAPNPDQNYFHVNCMTTLQKYWHFSRFYYGRNRGTEVHIFYTYIFDISIFLLFETKGGVEKKARHNWKKNWIFFLK